VFGGGTGWCCRYDQLYNGYVLNCSEEYMKDCGSSVFGGRCVSTGELPNEDDDMV
jgi:hypothetical protein